MLGLERFFVGSDAMRVHARKVIGACLAAGHVSLFSLAVTNRLLFSVPIEFKFLQLAASNQIWLLIHLLCAVVITISLVANRFQVQAMSMSSGALGAWGFIMLLGGMITATHVSLAGPVLALVLAAVAYSVAMSWAITPPRKKDEK